MANCLLAYGNRADEAELTDLHWIATGELQNRLMSRRARCWHIYEYPTLSIRLPLDRRVRVFALCGHDMPVGAKVRVRAYLDHEKNALRHDSGWLDAWPPGHAPGSLIAAKTSFSAAGIQACERLRFAGNFVHVLPKPVNASLWTVEIDLKSGHEYSCHVSRLFLSDAWQPAQNMSLQASVGLQTRTDVQESLGGTEYFDVRCGYRQAAFALGHLSRHEAMRHVLDMQRMLGIHQEILFVYDPDDHDLLLHNFLGRLTQVSPIEQTLPNTYATSFVIKEIV